MNDANRRRTVSEVSQAEQRAEDIERRDMELEADVKISSCDVRVIAFAAGLCIERCIEHFLRSQTV